MKILKYIVFILLAMLVWCVFIYFGATKGFLIKPFAENNTGAAFVDAVDRKIQSEYVGNLALGLVKNGEIANEYYHSNDQEIDRYTLFQMASVSKWVTSWAIHALVEEGILNLDASVDDYLKRWILPEGEFNNRDVTIRKLLSHTAGLVDGLGYGGFEEESEVQTLEGSLTKADDAWGDGETKVGYEPGTDYRYSGGGYTLMQLIIEEVSGMTFQKYMTKSVFEPLGMQRSTFVWSDTMGLKLATFYDNDSTIAPHYKYTSLAAASLYTCIDDLTKFLDANANPNPVLSESTKAMMMVPVVLTNNREIQHALGPMIYGTNSDGELFIGHDGGNRPAINTTVRFSPTTKEGIIALSSGSGRGIASQLGDEWIYQRGTAADFTVIVRNKKRLLTLLIGGLLGILVAAFWIIKRK